METKLEKINLNLMFLAPFEIRKWQVTRVLHFHPEYRKKQLIMVFMWEHMWASIFFKNGTTKHRLLRKGYFIEQPLDTKQNDKFYLDCFLGVAGTKDSTKDIVLVMELMYDAEH
jgi:hypothetical protein